jgi:hypothetical protein
MIIQLTQKTTIPATGPAFAGRRTLTALWRRVREAVAEANYAGRRVVETQAPWTADRNWTAR